MNQFIEKYKIGKNTKFCIGVMSKNCVDTIIDFCQDKGMPMIFIPSRRQIEHTGGYVNNWTTDEFCRYVRLNHSNKSNNILLERDHGGCYQGSSNDDGIDSLKCDCKVGNFDIVHIDPWVRYKDLDEGIAETIKLIKICYNENPDIYFEIGTEERIRYFTIEEMNIFMQEMQKQLPEIIYQRIIYLVIQCGTHLHENGNIGTYDQKRLIDMLSICKKYNVMSKEHNGDYVNDEILYEKLSLGIDSINIAPEFGQIETNAILDMLNVVDIDKFFDICYRSGKWKKWVNEEFDPFENKRTLILICGHYVFSTDEFKTLMQPYNQHMVNNTIRSRIIAKMEQLWTISKNFIQPKIQGNELQGNELQGNEQMKMSENKNQIDKNMWDIVQNDNVTSYLTKHDIDNFRRNGLVNGIEIGLLYSKRSETLKNRFVYIIGQNDGLLPEGLLPIGLLPKHYDHDYSIRLKKRFENLSQIVGKNFIINNMDCIIGNPQYSIFDELENININTNELYSIYDCWQILHCLKYSFITSLRNETPLSILEIGGGFGSLATKLLKNITSNNPSLSNIIYYSVDLPEILQLQEYYFNHTIENCDIKYYISDGKQSDKNQPKGKQPDKNQTDKNQPEGKQPEGKQPEGKQPEGKQPTQKITIILLKPEDLEQLDIFTRFDIVIQCRGFSEMNHETLQKYFSCIQKQINQNGLFYLGCQRYVAYRGKETMRIRDYPFDNNWTIMKSQPSWLATHGHDMALTRSYEAHMPFTEVLKSFPIITPPPGPLCQTINNNTEKWIEDNRVPLYDLL